MGETLAIKLHFVLSNLAFKQYAKVCFLGTIQLLGLFAGDTAQGGIKFKITVWTLTIG